MDNDDFIKFLKNFDDSFLMPVSEISRSHSGNRDILIHNSIEMYSLDDICKESRMLKSNLPKTTDALWYKVEDGKLTLYIIEFKFFNIDSDDSSYRYLNVIYEKLKSLNRPIDHYSDEKIISDSFLEHFVKIKDNFVDSVEVSLRLKPYETLMIALPLLFKEYNGDIKEFKHYLEDIDVKLYVFVNRVASNRNISAERSYIHSINNALNSQYFRLKQADLITYFSIRAAHQFSEFLRRENLI